MQRACFLNTFFGDFWDGVLAWGVLTACLNIGSKNKLSCVPFTNSDPKFELSPHVN